MMPGTAHCGWEAAQVAYCLLCLLNEVLGHQAGWRWGLCNFPECDGCWEAMNLTDAALPGGLGKRPTLS